MQIHIAVGDVYYYYGVIQSIHGDLCRLVTIRDDGKLNCVMIEGKKKGNERRGMVASDLKETMPNMTNFTWEV